MMLRFIHEHTTFVLPAQIPKRMKAAVIEIIREASSRLFQTNLTHVVERRALNTKRVPCKVL